MRNLKALMEKRAELHKQMEVTLARAETENRAMEDAEIAAFTLAEKEIQTIDQTVACEERARRIEQTPTNPVVEERASEEERSFFNYIAGTATEMRAAGQNMTAANNAAIIPSTIANRIIKEVKDRCPILEKAQLYNVKGTLKIPVWGTKNGTNDITVGYQEEFTEITATAGSFSSVDLSGYLVAALTLIGRGLENNGSFSAVNFVIRHMADQIAFYLEKELLIGTVGKASGALSTETIVKSNSATTISADELIDLQAKVKQVYQKDACWTMHPDTFTGLKKLKDNNGRYILQDDVSSAFPYRIFGKPVHLSDGMPKTEAGNKPILYGDYNGIAVNMRENISIEVLRELYAPKHAIGVIAWLEFDSKVTNHQKLAALQMKTA